MNRVDSLMEWSRAMLLLSKAVVMFTFHPFFAYFSIDENIVDVHFVFSWCWVTICIEDTSVEPVRGARMKRTSSDGGGAN
jgi:hypothetical protein